MILRSICFCIFLCIMMFEVIVVFFFFFSSRRRHTRWPRDWSSDVCSSDLRKIWNVGRKIIFALLDNDCVLPHGLPFSPRSEERRVGKECRSRRSPDH